MTKNAFWKVSLPFVMVNAIVWGVGSISLPLLAKTNSRAGLVFAMINLGIAIGAPIWGILSRKMKISTLVFLSVTISTSIWIVLTLLNGDLLVLMSLIFGFFTAGVFALATVRVTELYPKKEWDKYIARMQSYMTAGQVAGALSTSLYVGVAIGIPFLIVGLIASFPLRLLTNLSVMRNIHLPSVAPKSRFFDIMTSHYHTHFKLTHLVHFKNKVLLLFYIRWALILLAPGPVYAMYPLLMKGSFGVSHAISSIIYSVATALGVMLFIVVGKLSEKRGPFKVFNIGTIISVVAFVMMISVQFGFSGVLGIVGVVLMILSWPFVSVGMNVGTVELVEEQKEGEALGVANALMSLDNVAGGIFGGILASISGYSILFWIGLILSLGAFSLEFFHVHLRKAVTKPVS